MATADLPRLFNSSRKRKRSISSYIAPVHLRDTYYQCQEYPDGVYINRYGEVCPNVSVIHLKDDVTQDDDDHEDIDGDYVQSEISESDSDSIPEDDLSSNDVSDIEYNEDSVFTAYLKRKKDRIQRNKVLHLSQSLAQAWDEIKLTRTDVQFSAESDIFGTDCTYTASITHHSTGDIGTFEYSFNENHQAVMKCTQCETQCVNLTEILSHNCSTVDHK